MPCRAQYHRRTPNQRARPETVDGEAFVADAGVKRFDVAVGPWLAWRDEVQPDLTRCAQSASAAQASSGPLSHCRTSG
jgi:hypothetical protein